MNKAYNVFLMKNRTPLIFLFILFIFLYNAYSFTDTRTIIGGQNFIDISGGEGEEKFLEAVQELFKLIDEKAENLFNFIGDLKDEYAEKKLTEGFEDRLDDVINNLNQEIYNSAQFKRVRDFEGASIFSSTIKDMIVDFNNLAGAEAESSFISRQELYNTVFKITLEIPEIGESVIPVMDFLTEIGEGITPGMEGTLPQNNRITVFLKEHFPDLSDLNSDTGVRGGRPLVIENKEGGLSLSPRLQDELKMAREDFYKSLGLDPAIEISPSAECPVNPGIKYAEARQRAMEIVENAMKTMAQEEVDEVIHLIESSPEIVQGEKVESALRDLRSTSRVRVAVGLAIIFDVIQSTIVVADACSTNQEEETLVLFASKLVECNNAIKCRAERGSVSFAVGVGFLNFIEESIRSLSHLVTLFQYNQPKMLPSFVYCPITQGAINSTTVSNDIKRVREQLDAAITFLIKNAVNYESCKNALNDLRLDEKLKKLLASVNLTLTRTPQTIRDLADEKIQNIKNLTTETSREIKRMISDQCLCPRLVANERQVLGSLSCFARHLDDVDNCSQKKIRDSLKKSIEMCRATKKAREDFNDLCDYWKDRASSNRFDSGTFLDLPCGKKAPVFNNNDCDVLLEIMRQDFNNQCNVSRGFGGPR